MSQLSQPEIYNANELLNFATIVLKKSGLNQDKASTVAKTLLESDLMGHSTHGLNLLRPYVSDLRKGDMEKEGEPQIINDTGATQTWNGRHLPGAWLVHKATDIALNRVKEHPIITIVIRRSHHIGCLAAYPKRATQNGQIMILACSDPKFARVAPYGGLRGAYSPNPIAAGFPTESGPIIFDISTSETAAGVVGKAYKEEKPLPHPWLLDHEGKPTDDPNTFFSDTPSTILPLGGMETGYKGFALGIMIDALTGALGGYGRADQPQTWESSIFLQIINPDYFGGLNSFAREMQYLKDQCINSPVAPGNPPVRMPGDRALEMREKQRKEGLKLDRVIVDSLQKLAIKLDLDFPQKLRG